MTNAELPADLHVSFISDENYLIPLAAAGRSVIESCKYATLTIHVVSVGLSNAQHDRLRTSWEEVNVEVKFYEWDPRPFADWPTKGYFTTSVYARLLLPDLIKRSGRLISLDCDMCVVGDLSPLLKVDLSGLPIGAVREPYTPVVSWRRGVVDWAEEGLAPDIPYFNSGLMVVDLDRWHEMGVGELCLAYGKRHLDTLVTVDEECLNGALRGSWTELGQEWNTGPYWRIADRRTGQFEDILERRRVIHYQGIIKPWIKREDFDDHEDAHYFFGSLDRTAWRGWRP
ncbi:glycosyltransferase family 8 protein [Streptomyces sp. NPDC059679]|uniref:glycosyltransferase family 8 protein n=1 Tax=Streptomyces sp. NPDC059679 TaxID=3346903 RepID=UPI00369AEA89